MPLGAEQNAFRMSRLAPLVGPLTTCGRKGDAHALSLYYIASWCADHGFHGSTGWGCLYPGAEQNAFRMSRLAPLVSPLVTRGRGDDAAAFSLHCFASSWADHGFHGTTGCGCKLPGAEQNVFRMALGRTIAGEPLHSAVLPRCLALSALHDVLAASLRTAPPFIL